jgi:phage regulatory protein, rha family
LENLKVTESGLVYISQNNEIVCDSLQVAKKFRKRHNNVMRDIRGLLKNEQTKQMFNLSSYTEKQNGQVYQMYIMNRDGFSLLAMGFTGEKALEWKLKYIQAFNNMEKLLLQQQPLYWQKTRQVAKGNRLLETDIIKEFVAYAKQQGSQHADRYYYHLTSLANKAAGITEGRDKAGIQQLNSLILIEHIIKEVIRQGMAEGKYYKDIYADGKERIRQFREISFLTSKENT